MKGLGTEHFKEDDNMAISGIGSNYSNVYEGTYTTLKNDVGKKAETKEDAPAKTAATSDYYSYLQKNYDCMSNGSVAISSAYLKKCSGDPAKAKELEDFLKKIPELEKQGYEQLSAQNKALGGTVTYYQQTWMVHKDGSIQSTVYSVTETGMTNAEKMKKSMDERLEKQKEKKEKTEKTEKAEEKKVEKEEKAEEKKAEKAKQGEKLDGGMEKVAVSGALGPEITIKYVDAGSELEAKAMMQKEKLEDAYYLKFDVNI